jgi:hypothetical protein
MIDFTKRNDVVRTAVIVDDRGVTYSTPMPTRTGVPATRWLGVWFDRNTREWVVAEYADYRCADQRGDSRRWASRRDINAEAQDMYTAAMVELALSMSVAA